MEMAADAQKFPPGGLFANLRGVHSSLKRNVFGARMGLTRGEVLVSRCGLIMAGSEPSFTGVTPPSSSWVGV